MKIKTSELSTPTETLLCFAFDDESSPAIEIRVPNKYAAVVNEAIHTAFEKGCNSGAEWARAQDHAALIDSLAALEARAPTYFSKTHHGPDQQYESHGFARAIEHHHGITAAQKGGQHGF